MTTHLDHDNVPNTTEAAPQPEATRETRRSAVRLTSSGILLTQAITAVGIDRMAEALQVTTSDVERLRSDERPMSLRQQRTLAMAVLTLSADQPNLRRRAAALLGQVQAAEDFEARVAEGCASAPRLPFGMR